MDLEEIGQKLSNLTFYDLKQFYTQAKNYALNISEIEAKVREATNDDPWGASSTLMQEIAQATYNYHDFNEIMPTIFRRFMEKEAHDWRQIYKSLQLLEYLVKNGSERVVDEARAHLSTIKILRSFHYIDDQGKDQGLNIRNRAKELAALLSDVEMIRAERRKARANRTKYQGSGNTDFVPGSGGGRYGGFSSDAYYASGGSVGHSGSAAAYGSQSPSQPEYDEYDAGADESAPRSSSTAVTSSASKNTATSQPAVADLFSFDDDDEPLAAPQTTTAPAPALATAASAQDDFDDFQSAAPVTTSPPTTAAAPTSSGPKNAALFDLLDDKKTSATSTTTAAAMPPMTASKGMARPVQPTTAPKPSVSLFDDLWAESRGKASNAEDKGKKSMAQLAKDQTSNSVWASSTAPKSSQSGASKDLFDLL